MILLLLSVAVRIRGEPADDPSPAPGGAPVTGASGSSGAENVLRCNTECGASHFVDVQFNRTFSFAGSALRLALKECATCEWYDALCAVPFAEIPAIPLPLPATIANTTDSMPHTRNDTIPFDAHGKHLCCRRIDAEICTQSRFNLVWSGIRETCHEVVSGVMGLFLDIWLALFEGVHYARSVIPYVPLGELILLLLCIAALIMVMCFPSSTRSRSVSYDTLWKRLMSWPPCGVSVKTLKAEGYWNLLLPPGSVLWDMDSVPLTQRRPTNIESLPSDQLSGDQTVSYATRKNSSEFATSPKSRPSLTLLETQPTGSQFLHKDFKSETSQKLPFPYKLDPHADLKYCTPALFFINPKAGGRFGTALISSVRSLLHPLQVVDMNERTKVKPIQILRWFVTEFGQRCRLVVAGGDGSVGWVLSWLDELDTQMEEPMPQWPPVAIVPLGTGNDLARVLGWGGSYCGESLRTFLLDVLDARVVQLDRWQLYAERHKKRAWNSFSMKLRNDVQFNNYFGVGVDASVVNGFHVLRNRHPGLFVSRMINKWHYTWIGVWESVSRSCAEFRKNVTLTCDGKEYELDQDIEGIIVANIGSYAGGVQLWHAEDGGPPQSQRDGKLDVCLIRGADHLGLVQVGLARVVKLCQASKIELHFMSQMPMHCDGEPWLQPPCRLTIDQKKPRGQATFLKRTRGLAERQFNNLIFRAVEEGIISGAQQEWLQHEMSVRMENAEARRSSPRRDGIRRVLSLAGLADLFHHKSID
eukprot:GEMP01013765.1.p1 GENE.GEMP01013765.1~~GEMP01013765.1.p1  ORF type:complete len:768 (+),score=129.12 GEMP01013765.1:39-2306(+)